MVYLISKKMIKRIRAPAKILFGLRFKIKCKCGGVIPSDTMVCVRCARRRRVV